MYSPLGCVRSKCEKFSPRFYTTGMNKLPPLIELRAFDATANGSARENEQPGPSTSTSRGRGPRGPAQPETPGPASLLVHAQLAAHVRIKSAALAADTGEKNEPASGVAESISSLDDFIQLAEGLRLGVVQASSGGRESCPRAP